MCLASQDRALLKELNTLSKKRYLFTSESVTEGHPDKIADQISDAILDACLKEDPYSRVACETLTATGLVVIAGEITTKAYVDFQTLVRGVVASIGYDNALYGFDSNTCAVISTINKQSGDIAMGVDTGGAGDQGMMFGYAATRTPELMPTADLPGAQAGAAADRSAQEGHPRLTCGPTARSQVTVEYDENHKPVAHRCGRHLDAARPRQSAPKSCAPTGHEARHPGRAAGRDARCRHQVPHQPDRPLRGRRTAGRLPA